MPIPQLYMRFLPVLRRGPDAQADIFGGEANPRLRGTVRFYQTPQGVLVLAEVSGLPDTGERCKDSIFAFHIHSGGTCSGSADDPFRDAQGHYHPENCPHPAHAGDMPPLFGNGGIALSLFLTDRFSVREVIGRTAVIHNMPDDFTSQPSGNSGEKIACGEILRY